MLEDHARPVLSLAVAGSKLFSGSYDYTIKVWCLDTLTRLKNLTGESPSPWSSSQVLVQLGWLGWAAVVFTRAFSSSGASSIHRSARHLHAEGMFFEGQGKPSECLHNALDMPNASRKWLSRQPVRFAQLSQAPSATPCADGMTTTCKLCMPEQQGAAACSQAPFPSSSLITAATPLTSRCLGHSREHPQSLLRTQTTPAPRPGHAGPGNPEPQNH